MNVLLPTQLPYVSLCSGVGQLDRGFSVAMEQCGFDPHCICHVERDSYAAAVLVDRMAQAALDHAPVCPDLNTFPAKDLVGKVGAVVAGIPCQGHSVAGKRRIANDPRNLWPQTRVILRDCGASLFALENVGGFLIPNRSDGLEAGIRRVVHDLAEDGWVGVWGTLQAREVGANHQRERAWLLAHRSVEHGGEWLGQRFRAAFSAGRESGVEGRGEAMADGGRQRDQFGRVAGEFRSPSPTEHRQVLQRERDGDASGDCNSEIPGGGALDDGPSSRRNATRIGSEAVRESRERMPSAGCNNISAASRLEHPAGNIGDGGVFQSQRGSDRRKTSDRAGEGLPARSCRAMADVGGDGRDQGAEVPSRRKSLPGGVIETIPLFAPARNDYAEWLRVLSIDPTLMPAVRRQNRSRVSRDPEVAQSEVRGMVDGMGARLGFRADELRCIGNGVVWLQAAVAYYQLAQRLFGGVG